ncbi:MAG: UDP-N-acetylmuramoyl-L-alanyl-D-glutamate--2,6-diaminopimelate ligase [Ruminococcus sp.]|jgi:UDP-N-acetylmuramoyl-L-alanyl-D-glutamate--2,6-diaminopimelate ligase|nr:UDP-N-acetylmuramoyl-L-alanyl-D-glutamate--2,6-diaminopimelate ligase [Ruminococcus sp.]
MELHKLLNGIIADNEIKKYENIDIKGVTDDTRKVKKDFLFVCKTGKNFDSRFSSINTMVVGAAIVAATCDTAALDLPFSGETADREYWLGELQKRQIIIPDAEEFYGKVCARFFGDPQDKLKFIGVTGTNGKTTTACVLHTVLMKMGIKAGLIGTINVLIGNDELKHSDNTTPLAYEFFEILSKMVSAGCEYAVMEVSSFGLVQKRTHPTHFDISLFTNLTSEHLDYHDTMEEYYKAKKLLFENSDIAVINTDDDYGLRLFSEIDCEKFSFGTSDAAYFQAEPININPNTAKFIFSQNDFSREINMKMPGLFNTYNVAGVLAICRILKLDFDKVTDIISKYNGVKGRSEIIPTGRDFSVICDYAHTPDALENILKSIKTYCKGRLIVLFGCGGNRDASKRPLMAQVVYEYADIIIATSDNPRAEDPEKILDDVMTGLKSDKKVYRITDREEAIYKALKLAEKDDIVALCGKGHEDYQVISATQVIHFDEREIVHNGLKLL